MAEDSQEVSNAAEGGVKPYDSIFYLFSLIGDGVPAALLIAWRRWTAKPVGRNLLALLIWSWCILGFAIYLYLLVFLFVFIRLVAGATGFRAFAAQLSPILSSVWTALVGAQVGSWILGLWRLSRSQSAYPLAPSVIDALDISSETEMPSDGAAAGRNNAAVPDAFMNITAVCSFGLYVMAVSLFGSRHSRDFVESVLTGWITSLGIALLAGIAAMVVLCAMFATGAALSVQLVIGGFFGVPIYTAAFAITIAATLGIRAELRNRAGKHPPYPNLFPRIAAALVPRIRRRWERLRPC